MRYIQPLIFLFFSYRFSILCFSIFTLMLMHTNSGQWLGDFWEHSAVIRELSTNLLHPKHPQFPIDTTHAFYSPYSFVVAVFAIIMHMDSLSALSIAGIFNLCLFLVGIKFFVSSVVYDRNNSTTFYVILLTLFWWGISPWSWSGFFHIGVLGYVLPYPSTFSAAITLIALGLNQRRIKDRNHSWLAPVLFISIIVLISHPTTFLFLAAGLVAQCFTEREIVLNHLIITGIVLIASFLLAVFWPYFSIVSLFSDSSTPMRDLDSQVMYKHAIARIWPSFFGIPLLILSSIKSAKHRLLLLLLILLVGIYAAGGLSGRYSYGRIIAYCVFILHIAIAEYLVILEENLSKKWNSQIIIPATVAVFSLLLSFNSIKATCRRAFFERQTSYRDYTFLSQFTGQYDVVFSDKITSWIVPTFGGKVVVSAHPVSFIKDQYIRESDIEIFFKKSTINAIRQKIIQKYNPDFLLLKKPSDIKYQSLMPSWSVAFENKEFLLISFSKK